MDIKSELYGVFAKAMVKYDEGEKEHGVFDPDTDPRNMIDEAIEELLDGMNYMAMQVIRLQRKKEGVKLNG